MAELNLEEIRDTLISVAFEAGRKILAANPNDISTGTKLNCRSLITRLVYSASDQNVLDEQDRQCQAAGLVLASTKLTPKP